MKLTKGFTLIELLVVIAIIGILSSVVLASLTTARTRGQSASVQSQLSNMRAQAELYYSTNSNTYGSFTEGTCAVTTGSSLFGTTNQNNLTTLMAGVNGVVTVAKTACASNGTAWAAAAVDPSVSAGTSAFCVDSSGVSKTVTITANTPAGAISDSTFLCI